MKNLANAIVATLFLMTSVTGAFAQGKKDAKMEMKEHACTANCKKDKHMYACGEKGHTCTKACKKDMKMEKSGDKK